MTAHPEPDAMTDLDAYLTTDNGKEAVELLAQFFAISGFPGLAQSVRELRLAQVDARLLVAIRETLEPLQKLRDTVSDTGLRARNATADEVTEYAEEHWEKLAGDAPKTSVRAATQEELAEQAKGFARAEMAFGSDADEAREREKLLWRSPTIKNTRAGPEAADRIEALEARVSRALTLLEEVLNTRWALAKQVDIVEKLRHARAALGGNP